MGFTLPPEERSHLTKPVGICQVKNSCSEPNRLERLEKGRILVKKIDSA